MPRGPQGQKRPSDAVSCAVTVMKIATGEMEEDIPKNRDGKVSGGKARANSMTQKNARNLRRRRQRLVGDNRL